MLLTTMNPEEITKEIMKDYEILRKTTIIRLAKEYDKDRKVNKISRDAYYEKSYTIKSKSKNLWIISFSKCPSEPKYKDYDTSAIGVFTYYRTYLGLRVFKINGDHKSIVVYNGHLFQRYNERMKLGYTNTLDMAKHFFANNGYSTGKVFNKDGIKTVTAISKEGISFGDMKHGWQVFKTFITRDLARKDQTELEAQILDALRKDAKGDDPFDYCNIILKDLS